MIQSSNKSNAANTNQNLGMPTKFQIRITNNNLIFMLNQAIYETILILKYILFIQEHYPNSKGQLRQNLQMA